MITKLRTNAKLVRKRGDRKKTLLKNTFIAIVI